MNKNDCYKLYDLFKALEHYQNKIKLADDSFINIIKILILETENNILQAGGIIDIIGRRAKYIDSIAEDDDLYNFTIISRDDDMVDISYDDGDGNRFEIIKILLLD